MKDDEQKKSFLEYLQAERQARVASSSKYTEADDMMMKRTKDGSVLWKDIDKMLGGNMKVRASTIDLTQYRKLPSLGPPLVCDESENEEHELMGTVGDGLNKVEFIMEQIKTNKLFRNKLDSRIKTW